MCIATPGKVIQIKNERVIVDHETGMIEAINATEDLKLGDYVLVQRGYVLEKVPEIQAKRALEIMNNG